MNRFAACSLLLLLCACQTPEGGVVNKVMSDFGLKERPEGYVSGSDQIFKKLDEVGAAEMKRLNLRQRQGEIKYEEQGLTGLFYKEQKVYESFHPLDVNAYSGGTGRERGYNGYIQYRYRVMQSARKPTRVEAEAQSANIPTGDEGEEVYRYDFNASGAWNGAEGESAKP